MQELKKILEEIDAHAIEFELFGTSDDYISVGWVKDIIRKHMNAGWIPVEKALPPEPPEYVDDEGDLEQYIVMIDGVERPTTLRYAGDGTWWEDGTYYHVIAWRPMPEVYRPVDKTERSEQKCFCGCVL